jgi:hypothetical protein
MPDRWSLFRLNQKRMKVIATEIKGLKSVTLVNSTLTMQVRTKFLSERLANAKVGQAVWADGLAQIDIETSHGNFTVQATPQEFRALRGGGFVASATAGIQVIRAALNCQSCKQR